MTPGGPATPPGVAEGDTAAIWRRARRLPFRGQQGTGRRFQYASSACIPAIYFVACRFQFSVNTSQTWRRSPSRTTGPASVNSRYARLAGSNFGH